MTPGCDHSPRLTDAEYERLVVALHASLPPVPSKEEDLRVRRRTLDLAVDHRLGRDFPREQRDALWACQRRVERRRLRLMVKHLVKRLLSRGPNRDAQHLAAFVVDEYASVLTRAELEAFSGREESRNSTLPADREPR